MKILSYLALILGTAAFPLVAMEREVSKKIAEAKPQEALEEAIRNGTVDDLKKLLGKGADPNIVIRTSFGPVKPLVFTAGLAAIHGFSHYEYLLRTLSKDEALAKLKVLLDHGAIIENVPQESKSFFDDSNSLARGEFSGSDKEVSRDIEALLKEAQLRAQRPDVNKKDEHGKAQLHYAAGKNNVAEVQNLIKAGADVNIRDGHQNTPLHEAAFFGAVSVIEPLAKAGADLNARDKDGNTPLHKAVFNKQKGAVEKLIKLGASPDSKNNKGETPKDMAQSEDIKKALQEAQGEECAICLEKFTAEQPATVTKCLHKFHGHCINDASIKKCPLCRTVIKE